MTFCGALGRQVCVVGAQSLALSKRKPAPRTTHLIQKVLADALNEAHIELGDIDALISVPSLADPHFMEAHYQATELGLFSARNQGSSTSQPVKNGGSIECDRRRRRRWHRPLLCKTVDTGGAGPVTALLDATRMIQQDNGMDVVAVVAADTVGSMDSHTFLERADSVWLELGQSKCTASGDCGEIKSPAIPHGYDRVTDYQMRIFGLTRDQLRMVVCLESFHAAMHPGSAFHREVSNSDPRDRYTTIQELQSAKATTPHISMLECARRADGAGCLILASDDYLKRKGLYQSGTPTVIGGGEASGPLYPSMPINEDMFSCDSAMTEAYMSAGNLDPDDIDFFGLVVAVIQGRF
jgi:hypothetical protein